MPAQKNVLWFSEVDKDDVAIVGGKGANLGEMFQAGFPVPDGFIVTSLAYKEFVKSNNLDQKIKHLLNNTDLTDSSSLNKASENIKKHILDGEISKDLVLEIYLHYKKLGGIFSDALVAVRSSATAEDLPGASFAGQQETFLNVRGEANLIHKIKEAWASLFEARAIFYRHENKFDHTKVLIAVPVQKMVQSDRSGVMFTLDPLTNDKSKIIIEAIYGLGEMIVQGKETPDHYEVDKRDLSILKRQISKQQKKMIKVGKRNIEIGVGSKDAKAQKITDREIKEVAMLGKKLEHHYFFPQDVEWAIEKHKAYIVQTRPVTTTQKNKTSKKDEEVNLPVILKGDGGSPGIASGSVRILKGASEIGKLEQGEVLVASETNPDYVPAMKKAKAIVTDHGGRTSHAAIVSREIGVPAVVGTKNATKVLKNGEVVTVNGSKGEVYKGGFISAQNGTPAIYEHIKTATKIYVNLAEPELAQKTIPLNPDGVGLLRAEFMMAKIGIHPKKLIKEKRKNFFVEKLSEGLVEFCRVFDGKPVVYRASDFKSNEYRNLIGGKEFEPTEPNPMLGYRGAFRYIHDPSVFELELEAIKTVRNKKGYKNLHMMVPFVRSVKELEEVKTIISRAGLHRSANFKLWMMVEIPTNVVLLEDFIDMGIDGVSIGTNDLTMLMLGTDRDNDEVSKAYNETDPSVLWALEKIIKTAHSKGVTSSICGQAGSNPEILEKVIPWGITSVSVSPDAIQATRKLASEIEKNIIMKR